jgi:transposase
MPHLCLTRGLARPELVDACRGRRQRAARSWTGFFDGAATVEIAKVTRLATTIDRWRGEVLAYFRTGRSSSGPVEAVNGGLPH